MKEEGGIPKVSMAEKFMVVDESGNKRAVLGFSQGEISLTLFGSDGFERAVLKLDKDGHPNLKLFDRKKIPRIAIGLKPDGSPYMTARKKGANESAPEKRADKRGQPQAK